MVDGMVGGVMGVFKQWVDSIKRTEPDETALLVESKETLKKPEGVAVAMRHRYMNHSDIIKDIRGYVFDGGKPVFNESGGVDEKNLLDAVERFAATHTEMSDSARDELNKWSHAFKNQESSDITYGPGPAPKMEHDGSVNTVRRFKCPEVTIRELDTSSRGDFGFDEVDTNDAITVEQITEAEINAGTITVPTRFAMDGKDVPKEVYGFTHDSEEKVHYIIKENGFTVDTAMMGVMKALKGRSNPAMVLGYINNYFGSDLKMTPREGELTGKLAKGWTVEHKPDLQNHIWPVEIMQTFVGDLPTPVDKPNMPGEQNV